ncbi:hypothetical protein [Staphylococcus phage vB_SurM-PSU4]|nr:hypothetical protein [Staphylococcus phage vB_SurM-PSU4]
MTNSEILEGYLDEARDKVDTYELMELNEVERVLGTENFMKLYETIEDHLTIEERLHVYGSLDKLLNANKSDFVKYEEGTVYRKHSPIEEKAEFYSSILSDSIGQAIEDIRYNLKNTGETVVMSSIIEYIVLGSDLSEEDSLYSTEVIKYLRKNKNNLSKMLDNLKVIDDNVENGYYLDINFNKEEEPNDKEMLEILKLINF